MSKKIKPAIKIIPAVGYLRKSTNEETTEKSIADQKARIKLLEPLDRDAKYDIVRWYEKDKGVPGHKRGAKRPDYYRMVQELLTETKAKAILVDDADRFSRADELEVVHDVQELREKYGIRWIHCASQGCVDLVNDPMACWKIALWAMASHEFSKRLSRRISHARLDAAKKYKRSGGTAPYGMENDGNGGLKFGDSKEVKVVRQIFDWFVRQLKSMNWIAGELNRQRIPASFGGKWFTASVRELLRHREYRGDFTYNSRKSGRFHIVNGNQEVVAVSQYDDADRQPWKVTDEGRIVKEGIFKPLIDPEIFDAAQKRLATFELKGGRKPRVDGFPLSRVLVCDNCDNVMNGCQPTGRSYRIYRCAGNSYNGAGTCKSYEIREELILPVVMRMLGEEITDLQKLLSSPPEELVRPNKRQREERAAKQRERDELEQRIQLAVRNIMFSDDARTRRDMDAELTKMRDTLERLDAELSEVPRVSGYSREDLAALNAWWEDFQKRAVSVPVPGKWPKAALFHHDPFSDEGAVLLDARVVNEALHALGCEVRLRWRTDRVRLKNGKEGNRHTLVKGRFRLGQRTREVRFNSANKRKGQQAEGADAEQDESGRFRHSGDFARA